jgi:hypothetical protein
MMSKRRRHDRVEPKAMLDSQNLVAGGRRGFRIRTALSYIQNHTINAHRPLRQEHYRYT